MKKVIIIALALSGVFQASAQTELDLNNEQQLREVLSQNQFSIDSNAKAIVLSRHIKTSIENPHVNFLATRETYEYSIDFTAKILSDEAATDLSLINIPRTYGTTITNISAEAYNLEGGTIKKTSLSKDEIMKENLTDGIQIIKFNLPGVKKGSVIHYTYKTIRPTLFDVPNIYLQLEYPIEYETYELMLPYFLNCKKIERVNARLVTATTIDQLKTCEACSWTENYGGGKSTFYKWARRKVPAFKKEPLMGGEDNYKERIRIQVQGILVDGITKNYLDDWDNFSKNFLYPSNDIEQAFKGNAFLSDKVTELTRNKSTEQEKAQAIYAFVRDSFSTGNQNENFDIKTTFNKKAGSAFEINLLLVAMLRKAKLNSAPVFLSPKPNEKLNSIFPDNNNLSVLIAYVELNKKETYLDATQKHLGFGFLQSEDYNGYARLVSEKSKGVNLDPDMVVEKSITAGKLRQGEKPGQLVLSLDSKLGAFEAYEFRQQLGNDTAKIRKAIVKSLKDYGSFSLNKYAIENLENPDAPLKIHFEATWDVGNTTTIYLNPFFDKFVEKNPFTAPERTYPIELDRKEDKLYSFSIQLPKEYVIDDYPKSSIQKFDSAGSMELTNLFSFDAALNTLTIKSTFHANECNYPANYYDGVKAFYDKCVEAQQQQVVIKKSTL